MPWTTPVTWSNSAVVGATDLNEQVRDNMAFLFSPTFSMIVTAHTAAAFFSASASTAVPIATGLSATLTTYGGAIQCYFAAKFTAAHAILNLDYNGTAYSELASALISAGGGAGQHNSYHVWITGLPSGTHVFTPTWQHAAGSWMKLDASANPIVFWVREG